MKNFIDRRAFLKLASLATTSSLGLPYLLGNPKANNENAQNILIILFDTLSARHINLYGYPRETMPNLAKFAKRANVYHNHYSTSSFTSPATASLLTGVYPWTHEVLSLEHRLKKEWNSKNVFSLFKDFGYHQIAYSHNPYPDILLRQFRKNISRYISRDVLYLNSGVFEKIIQDDFNMYINAKNRILSREDGISNSLGLSQIFDQLTKLLIQDRSEKYEFLFPRGLPSIYPGIDNYFLLEDAIDFIIESTEKLPNPFLGYFHLLPPHRPYNTRRDYYKKFKLDGYEPIPKPVHLFSNDKSSNDLSKLRDKYDEYILYVDAEFGRLINALEKQGILDTTWLIFTSDHGEMLERGIAGHLEATLHQPVIKIPLLVSMPGQRERKDIYSNTSSLDVLPTLLKVTGQSLPDWLEGEVLPPFRDNPSDPLRNIFAVMGIRNSQFKPLTKATITLFKDNYKLTKYFGYEELEKYLPLFELYDLESDPEELDDLYNPNTSLTKDLNNILQSKLDEINSRHSN